MVLNSLHISGMLSLYFFLKNSLNSIQFLLSVELSLIISSVSITIYLSSFIYFLVYVDLPLPDSPVIFITLSSVIYFIYGSLSTNLLINNSDLTSYR